MSQALRLSRQCGDRSTYGLEAQVVSAGPKGSVASAPHPLRTYTDFETVDGRYAYCAWLIPSTGGGFPPPWRKGEQWLVSVQHTDDDLEQHLATLERFARSRHG